MVSLEDIAKDSQIRSLHGDEVVKDTSVDKICDSAIRIGYQKSAGGHGDQILLRSDESRLELPQTRTCTKSRRAAIRQGENRRGSGVCWLQMSIPSLFSTQHDRRVGTFRTKPSKAWAGDAPDSELKLALEAWCIQLAHLVDPMIAEHTKNEIFSRYNLGENAFLPIYWWMVDR